MRAATHFEPCDNCGITHVWFGTGAKPACQPRTLDVPSWAMAADAIRKEYRISRCVATKGGRRLYKAVLDHLDFIRDTKALINTVARVFETNKGKSGNEIHKAIEKAMR